MKNGNNKNMKMTNYRKLFVWIFPIFILLVISILSLYGASFIASAFENHYKKQIIWIFLSLLIGIIVFFIDFNFFKKISPYIYIIGTVSLILVLIFGKEINGARAWFKIGPITLQPSELFKFFYLIYLAKICENKKSKSKRLKILTVATVPMILIFIEPDTGVVLLYIFLTLGVILSTKVISNKHIIIFTIISIFLSVSFFSLYIFQEYLFVKIFGTSFFYRIDRLLMFKNSSSYQLENALIGIGSSGLFGHGIYSTKIYIPEATTDFIFALSICNFGLIGGSIIILSYFWIFSNLIKTYLKTNKLFIKGIIGGTIFMMLVQVFEHIFMNMGLTPITGITLPFLSYGGSSLISYVLIFSFILKITTNNSSYN